MIKLIKSTYYNEKETTDKLIEFIKNAKQLSFGDECKKFESNFAKYQGRKHCVFLNSGSSANLAILQSLLNLGKLQKGDKVAFSSLTWSTNVMPIIQLGLEAIPVDVELDTLNVSSSTFKQILKTHTDIKALFLTNLLGFSDDIDNIHSICRENNILLIEDNCESLGSVYKGKKLGNYSIASTFSFYVGHHMSTIEGGAVCTDSEELATMLHLVRAHGWDRNLPTADQYKIRTKFNINSTFYSRYTFYDLGYNMRPTEINGFLGNIQIQYINEIINKRNKNFIRLASEIYSNSDRYYPIEYEHMDFVSNFAFPLVCKSEDIRNELVSLCDKKVEIRPIVGGDMTHQPFYKKYMSKYMDKINESNASIIHKQGLYFGNNPEMTDDDINMLIEIFGQRI